MHGDLSPAQLAAATESGLSHDEGRGPVTLHFSAETQQTVAATVGETSGWDFSPLAFKRPGPENS